MNIRNNFILQIDNPISQILFSVYRGGPNILPYQNVYSIIIKTINKKKKNLELECIAF